MDEIVSTLIFEIDTSEAVNELDQFELRMATALERLEVKLGEFAKSVAKAGSGTPDVKSEPLELRLTEPAPPSESPTLAAAPAANTNDSPQPPVKKLSESTPITVPHPQTEVPQFERQPSTPKLTPDFSDVTRNSDSPTPVVPPTYHETQKYTLNPTINNTVTHDTRPEPSFVSVMRDLPTLPESPVTRATHSVTEYPASESRRTDLPNFVNTDSFGYAPETKTPTLPEDSLEKLASQNSTLVSLTETIVQYLKGLAEPQPEYYKVDVE